MQRMLVKENWEDLRLAQPVITQLKALAANESAASAAVVLFSGTSDTDKPMAAGVLANALGRPLYRVDLAGAVSKYIGETEKNLSQLFAEAQAQNAVLFFDEADAIFGKRTEVKDAHDRYANLETGYLLHRIETYPGLVILASNHKEALDTTFIGRMSRVIDFTPPKVEERLPWWRRVFKWVRGVFR